ncbi:MAG: hypothetical protein ACREDR_13560 [Blastocatellia bacterium]
MLCPSFELLIDFADGVGRKRAGLSKHVTECADCSATLQWYARVREIASTDDSVEPPTWVLRRALRLYEDHRKPRLVERLGQAIASLVFDSNRRTAVSGVRSSAGEPRQLLYTAGSYSVDIQVGPAARNVTDLLGQVLSRDEAGFDSVTGLTVQLMSGDRVAQSTLTNHIGEFAIARVKQGEYDLKISLGEDSIVLRGLPVTLN